MTLEMILNQADHVAALQQWVASPSGGSAGGSHQMNATVTPVIESDGGVSVQLNF